MNIVAGALAGMGPGAGWRLGADEAAANHCIAIQGSMIGRADDAGPAASGLDFTGASFTLTKQDQHAVAMCLTAKGGAGRMDGESETLIPTNGGVFDVAPTITAQFGEQTGQDAMNAGLVAHTLRADGFDASEDGTGRGTPLVPVCFDPTQITSGENRCNPLPGDPCHTLAKGAHAPAIAFAWQAGGGETSSGAFSNELSPTLPKNQTMAVSQSMQVRRLTPIECERLMGFPDGYTAITWRGKPAADGPRYKALGNSWATNCARWVGRRIAMVDQLSQECAA